MTARLVGLLLLAFVTLGASLLVGGVDLAPGAIFNALAHPHASADVTIVWQLRLPRVVIAAAVGLELSVAGALLQGMLRNPLVDPYLTGVSAGAAAAITLAIVAGVAAPLIPGIGFIAGLGAALLVASLARRGAGLDANRLILAGVSLSALFSAFIALILTRGQSADYAAEIISWLAGSMAGRGWNDLALSLPYAGGGLILAALAVPMLNALRVGTVRAAAAGVNVDRAQWLLLASAALLTASAVALAGMVGFVGLIVPHLARRIVGSDARVLVPACALLGMTLCMLADAAARTLVAPAELPVGVLLAFIGVPTFLYLYLRGGVAA
ncbi:MAG TPA: iron ABC transporter permease [Candidatus Baltobacteraceae bacterium]